MMCQGNKSSFYWDMIPVNNQNRIEIPTWLEDSHCWDHAAAAVFFVHVWYSVYCEQAAIQ